MSALARWLVMEGKSVAGYDKTETPLTRHLTQEGMLLNYVDSLDAIPTEYKGKDVLVVFTPAVPVTSEQYQYFVSQGNKMIKNLHNLTTYPLAPNVS